MTPSEKLSELAIDLPSPPAAAGLYKPVLVENDLIYFSGHLPIRHDGTMITGKVGDELTVEDGKAAARQVGLAQLAGGAQRPKPRQLLGDVENALVLHALDVGHE